MSDRWTKFRVPDAYTSADDAFVFVPTRSAANENEAFEHLLTDQTDWSMREGLRDQIRADYRYAGVKTITVCDHDLAARCTRSRRDCRVPTACHVFELHA